MSMLKQNSSKELGFLYNFGLNPQEVELPESDPDEGFGSTGSDVSITADGGSIIRCVKIKADPGAISYRVAR
jgi:hypothetical protein